jgi:RNA polymerase sigma-70 factor, ECF subfamily
MEILESVRGWRIVQCTEDADGLDRPLLHRAQGGDLSATQTLLERHEKAVGTVCLGMLGNRDDADDAVQETLLQALRGLPRFRGASSFRTWLYRIAVNTCLNHRRRSRPAELWDDVGDRAGFAESPEAATVRKMLASQALSQLLPRQRALIVLREVEGLSAEEIGQAMGWNEQKVRNELYKARQVLREWVRAQRLEDGGSL